jgi:predicted choloylglycine hydrolase
MALELSFRSLEEQMPGEAWRLVFQHGWPGWRDWFLHRGGASGPTLTQSRLALRRHMPELEPIWERLVAVAGADETAAQFLTFWNPPRYLVNCSQAVILDHHGPMLIRNYDLDPALNEATVYRTGWQARQVMGMVEGMAGLADGMNDAGLAVSLTFGGRIEHGRGFGIPLVIRYLLEVCADVEEALAVLRHLPSHMSYNLTLLDRGGNWATVMLAPDRPPIITRHRFATNHQLGVEWPRHAQETLTLERAECLARLTADPAVGGIEAARAFLAPPLFARGYDKGFGTVYTAVYRPLSGLMALLWPDGTSQSWTFADFPARRFRIRYGRDAVSPPAPAAGGWRMEAGPPGHLPPACWTP